MGVPGEDIGTVVDAGAVQVIYGSGGGLTAAGNQLWSQDSPGIAGAAEYTDEFGSAVTAANFGNSGHVGVPE